jgi:hypothetical protein
LAGRFRELVAFLHTFDRAVFKLHSFTVTDIPVRTFSEYISCLVVAGSSHSPPLTNPFHTPVVPIHYTPGNPVFKLRTAPKKAYIFPEMNVR